MDSDLRRSFKQKAKQAFELPSRLRKGLTDHLDGSDVQGRPTSFDFGYLLQDDPSRIHGFQATAPSRESDVGGKSRQRIPAQPSGTFKHHVMARDTLRSLAAQHGTTSSELRRLNRLHSDTIFEGQTLYIPDGLDPARATDFAFPDIPETQNELAPPPILLQMGSDSTDGDQVFEAELEIKQEEVELLSYKPLQRLLYGGQDLLFTGIKPILSVTKHIAPDLKSKADSSLELSGDGDIQFIKVPARHIKDKEKISDSVSGLLLLSADFVMFDPDPCDLKVREGSIEEFSTIIPIMSIASITLIRSAESLASDKNQIIIKDTGEQLSNRLHDIELSQPEPEEKGGDVPSPAGSRVESGISRESTPKRRTASRGGRDETRSGRREAADYDEAVKEGGETKDAWGAIPDRRERKAFDKKRSASVRKERPLSIVGSLFRLGGLEPSSEVSTPTATSSGLSGGSTSVENVNICSSQPGGSRLVSRTLSSISSYSSSLIDDVSSHLFPATLGTPKHQAVSASPSTPAPSPSSQVDPQEDRVFFLKPIDVLTKKVKEQLSSSVESAAGDDDDNRDLFLMFKILPDGHSKHSSSDLKEDYVFSIQPDRTATLLTFFLYWTPNSHEVPSSFNEPWFVSADPATCQHQHSFAPGIVEEIERKKRAKEWKIVNLQELKRLVRISEIEKLPLPELTDESRIIDPEMMKQLTFHLPPRAEGCKWNLVYGTEVHGFSLKTLFRRAEKVEGPIMLLVKDDKSQIFGAMLSCTLKPCDTFYGNGETYLFSFHKKFKKFGWSGLNSYFIHATPDGVSVGSGEGAAGLWLDGDLFYGRTQRCPTFGNEPLTESEDFVVSCLEVWRFV